MKNYKEKLLNIFCLVLGQIRKIELPWQTTAALILVTSALGPIAFVHAQESSSLAQHKPEVSVAQELIEDNDFESAVRYLEDAINLCQLEADLYNLLGYANQKMENFEAAGLAYDTALELEPQHRSALAYQGELFVLLGQIELAGHNLTKLSRICASGCDEYFKLKAYIDANSQ